MKKFVTATFVLTCCLCGLSGCGSDEKAATLRFKYLPGAQFEYRQAAVRHWEVIEGDSTIQKTTSDLTYNIRQVVRRMLEDSTAELLEQLTWDIVVPNKEDSTKLDTLHDSRDMIVYIKPRGTIVDLEFITDIDSTERQYLREYYEQGFMVFPEEPVKSGHIWTQAVDVALADTTATASTTFTVQGFDTHQGYDVVRIGYDGTLIIPIHERPSDTLRRSGLDRIHMQGILSFAPAEGMVIGMTEKWQVDGDRQRFMKGERKQFKIRGNMDVTYDLVSAERPQ